MLQINKGEQQVEKNRKGQGTFTPLDREPLFGPKLHSHSNQALLRSGRAGAMPPPLRPSQTIALQRKGLRPGKDIISRRKPIWISESPRQLARQPDPQGAAKTQAVAKTLSFNPNWSYIVYADGIKLRYYDPGPKGQPETTIGTIPWISNNPGNMGLNPNITPAPSGLPIPEQCKSPDKTKQVGPDSQQAQPSKLGAIGIYACRYAIFPTLETSMKAILPYLRGFAAKSPDMTVEMALRNFKGLEDKEKQKMEEQRQKGEPAVDVRDTYVNDIKAYMFKAMQADEAMEIGTDPQNLEVAELKAISADVLKRIKSLMNKKVLDVTDDDADMQFAVKGIMKNEGIQAPPGVVFRCDGFVSGDPKLYDGKQKGLIDALKASDSAKSELRLALGCK